MSDLLTTAAAVQAETTLTPAADLAYVRLYLTAVSPGHACAIACRIADATGTEAVHNVERKWWDVGPHVTVIYDNEEVRP